jgi:hypothetical protein
MANDDWTDICALTGEVGHRYGRDIGVRDAEVAVGELVGLLIDHGVVPGDLRGAFEPWSGSRQERVDQVRREMIAMDRMPWPGQVAWFFRENNTALSASWENRSAASGSTRSNLSSGFHRV